MLKLGARRVISLALAWSRPTAFFYSVGLSHGYIQEEIIPMRFLRLKEVMSLTGLGRSTIYKFMADETDFPKSVPLGGRAVAWVESEIEEWMESRLSMRDNAESFQ